MSYWTVLTHAVHSTAQVIMLLCVSNIHITNLLRFSCHFSMCLCIPFPTPSEEKRFLQIRHFLSWKGPCSRSSKKSWGLENKTATKGTETADIKMIRYQKPFLCEKNAWKTTAIRLVMLFPLQQFRRKPCVLVLKLIVVLSRKKWGLHKYKKSQLDIKGKLKVFYAPRIVTRYNSSQ